MSDEVEDAIAAELEPDAELAPEGETPEPDEPEDEPEPEPEDEPEDVVDSEAEMQRVNKLQDMMRKYGAGKMGEIYAEHASEFAECPFCSYWGTPGWIHIEPVPEDLKIVLSTYMNQKGAAQLKGDTYSRQCDACGGEGQVDMRSHAPGQEALPCIPCNGRGWIPVGPERDSSSMYVPNGPQPAYTPPADTSAPMFVPSEDEPDEVAALRAKGYVVMPPLVTG